MRLIDGDELMERCKVRCSPEHHDYGDYRYTSIVCGLTLTGIQQVIDEMGIVDAVPVVRCAECAVPHNRWTGCPKLGGLIPPDDFYCGFGRKDGADNG